MHILLIGGTGVLSSAVTKEAMRRGIAVTMITRGLRKIPPGVESIVCNNKEYEKIETILTDRKFDAIIDFLCVKPEQLEKSFILYSKHTNQYFFISSCSVYDTTTKGLYSENDKKVRKEWPYSVEKWECEVLLQKLAMTSACHYTIVRPCLTYGNTRLPYGIAPVFGKHWTLIARIIAGKPIIRWNHGVNRWNMMRVEDFAIGMVGLIGNTKAYGEAVNICGDEMPSYDEVLQSISRNIGKPVITVDIDSAFYASEMPANIAGEIIGGRSADLTCDNGKIKRLVPEFKQSIGLDEGIAKTIAAYQSENYQLGIDWFFDAKTDRIIEKWLRLNNEHKRYRIGYVDYLQTGKLSDRFAYYEERYRGSLKGRFLSKFFRIGCKLKKSILSV